MKPFDFPLEFSASLGVSGAYNYRPFSFLVDINRNLTTILGLISAPLGTLGVSQDITYNPLGS